MILTAVFTLGRSCKPRWLLCWPNGATSFWLRPWRPSKRTWPVLQTRGSRCRGPCTTGTTELWLVLLPSGCRLLRWDMPQLQSVQPSSSSRAMLWCKHNAYLLLCFGPNQHLSTSTVAAGNGASLVHWQHAYVMVAVSQSSSIAGKCSSHGCKTIQ